MKGTAWLTMPGGRTREFKLPDRLPQAGEVYEWAHPGTTLGGHEFRVGDTMELLERTNEAPFEWFSSVGNWRVKTKYGVSVWSSIDESIAMNHLQLVDTGRPKRTVWDRLNEDPG